MEKKTLYIIFFLWVYCFLCFLSMTTKKNYESGTNEYMTKKQVMINNQVNTLLRNGLLTYEMLETNGNHKLATYVLRQTSEQAHNLIISSGLDVALRDFWSDKKALACNIN